MESILTSNPTSGALYNFCYGITTGEPIQPIGPNRGLFISYDGASNFTGITVCFFKPNGTTFTHEIKLGKMIGSFRTNFILECEVYGVGGMGESGVTCSAIA
jgi:hypothetical protein